MILKKPKSPSKYIKGLAMEFLSGWPRFNRGDLPALKRDAISPG